MGSIKKFFTNKTTITFVGVILGIIVLVGGYFFRVNKSLSDVKIPIAKRTLNATEVITSADIEYVKVNPEFYGTLNVYTQYEINDLVNKYVSWSVRPSAVYAETVRLHACSPRLAARRRTSTKAEVPPPSAAPS